ncbi:MAG: DUF6660 family protein [Bacteroidales bacterium]
MKPFAFLLSVYIFCLASAPCVDEVLTLRQECGQTEHHQAGAPADHADACSPFCICSCCSVPVTLLATTGITHPFFTFQRSIISESSQITSFFAVTFWQPPKIG